MKHLSKWLFGLSAVGASLSMAAFGAPSRPVPAATNTSAALPGNLLIADEGNDRLLIVNPNKQVLWSMSLRFPGSSGADDAFLTPDQRHIVINEEDHDMIALIDIATKKVVWRYGHFGVPGSRPGYLNTPDDAYQLPNGTVTVADIKNHRILFINRRGNVIKQYGITGVRYHNPPHAFAAPNGDTPLADGGMLVTEINGSYVDRIDARGHLVYTVHFRGTPYPSDTQLLPNGNLLVAGYTTPGNVEIVNRWGQILWNYHPRYGFGELAQPSLAISLPNGDVALNDDYNNRVIIINPRTNKILWQYGHDHVAGYAPGYLNTPDGIDFLPATWKLP